jgi:hypothetical protein
MPILPDPDPNGGGLLSQLSGGVLTRPIYTQQSVEMAIIAFTPSAFGPSAAFTSQQESESEKIRRLEAKNAEQAARIRLLESEIENQSGAQIYAAMSETQRQLAVMAETIGRLDEAAKIRAKGPNK